MDVNDNPTSYGVGILATSVAPWFLFSMGPSGECQTEHDQDWEYQNGPVKGDIRVYHVTNQPIPAADRANHPYEVSRRMSSSSVGQGRIEGER